MMIVIEAALAAIAGNVEALNAKFDALAAAMPSRPLGHPLTLSDTERLGRIDANNRKQMEKRRAKLNAAPIRESLAVAPRYASGADMLRALSRGKDGGW